MTTEQDARLPPEIADRFTLPFARFLKVEVAAGAALLVVTVAALALSNSPWSRSFLGFWEMPIGLHIGAIELTRSLRHWINDALMTLFFFVVALELKRELILGELRNLSMAALSIAGALGGMLVPAALYLALMHGRPGAQGWGTVMATDTAFLMACLALLGARIPPTLRVYLLSLAICDDVGAIVVVAAGYGHELNWVALGLALLGLAIVAGAGWIGIRSIAIFFMLGGTIWLCFDLSGIHPTITGVVLGLMTPTGGWVSDARLRAILHRVLSYPIGEHWSGDTAEREDLRRAGTAATEALSPVERLEMMLHPWVGLGIVPAFAAANVGVSISGGGVVGSPVVTAIVVGLVFGKPVGVVAFSWIAVRLGLASRADGLGWPLIAAGALLTGIGFTMSLLIAGLAFSSAMLDAAKIAVLAASVVSALAGLAMLAWLTRGGGAAGRAAFADVPLPTVEAESQVSNR